MITFQMITFNSDPVLEQVIKSLLPWGRVVVTEGPVKFWQKKGYTTSTDRTNEILHDYLPSDDIIHGQWSEKDEMMNAAIHRIPAETDYVWMFDSDEVPTHAMMKVFCEEILPSKLYDSVSFNWNSFYGGFDHIMTGFEAEFENYRIQRWYKGAKWHTHRPPTVLSPGGTAWRNLRGLKATKALGFALYHYSYVFPFQVRAKTRYYHDWSQTIEGYFENVYLPWVTGNDVDKVRIEAQYQGVHDWLQERRGPCFTKPFDGKHPKIIEDILPTLRQKFATELKQCQS